VVRTAWPKLSWCCCDASIPAHVWVRTKGQGQLPAVGDRCIRARGAWSAVGGGGWWWVVGGQGSCVDIQQCGPRDRDHGTRVLACTHSGPLPSCAECGMQLFNACSQPTCRQLRQQHRPSSHPRKRCLAASQRCRWLSSRPLTQPLSLPGHLLSHWPGTQRSPLQGGGAACCVSEWHTAQPMPWTWIML
jgi:hypothetical protein